MASRSKVRAFFPRNADKRTVIAARSVRGGTGRPGSVSHRAPPLASRPSPSPRSAGRSDAPPPLSRSPSRIATHRSPRSPWWPPAPGRLPPASQHLQRGEGENNGGQREATRLSPAGAGPARPGPPLTTLSSRRLHAAAGPEPQQLRQEAAGRRKAQPPAPPHRTNAVFYVSGVSPSVSHQGVRNDSGARQLL